MQSLVLTHKTEKPSTIQELFSGWEDDGFRHKEVDWGRSEGNELKW